MATATQHIHNKEINMCKGPKHNAAIQCKQPGPWSVSIKVIVHNTQTKLWEKGFIAKVHPELKAYNIQINRAVYHRMEKHLKPYQLKPMLPTPTGGI